MTWNLSPAAQLGFDMVHKSEHERCMALQMLVGRALGSGCARLFVDVNADGVVCPMGLATPENGGLVRFDLFLESPVPILDLEVNEHGVSAGLSFSRRVTHCHFPWLSIVAITNASDVVIFSRAATDPKGPAPEPEKPKARASHLSVVR